MLWDTRDNQSDFVKIYMGLSTETALKLDTVIHPAVCINHDLLLDCPLIAFSKFWACSDVTYIFNIKCSYTQAIDRSQYQAYFDRIYLLTICKKLMVPQLNEP